MVDHQQLDSSDSPPLQPPIAPKKDYSAPEVIEFGTFHDLTQSTINAGGGDNFGADPLGPPDYS